MADTRPHIDEQRMTEIPNPTPEPTPLNDIATPAADPRRRRWPWIAAVVLVAGVLVVITQTNGSDPSANGTDAATTLNTAEVVVADLEEVTTLNGTLGREAGDPLTARQGGTVTLAPEPGDVLEPGDILFEIDGEPVVLLDGAAPAFRDLQLAEDTIEVAARSNGTITWLPEEGTTIEAGEALFEINGEPVILLYGDVPSYRRLADLRTDIEGDDVLQLEQALLDLGYATTSQMTVDGVFTNATESRVEVFQEAVGQTDDGAVDLGEVIFLPGPVEVTDLMASVGDFATDGKVILVGPGTTPLEGDDVLQLEASLAALGFDADGTMAIDGTFTSETVTAVTQWQTSTGMEADGVVDLGEVIFLEGLVRIAGITAPEGTSVNPGGPVLQVTGNDIVIVAQLPAADQGIVSEGDPVTVELPNNSRTSGTVTEVATVAIRVEGATFFEVTVVLDDPTVAGDLDEAPVDVDIVTDSANDVLAIPVTALLALREGGFAVEVDTGDGLTTLVAVEPGFFADGLVEVEAPGLQPGMSVVVP